MKIFTILLILFSTLIGNGKDLTQQKLDSSVLYGLNYLVRNCDKNGKFRYLVNSKFPSKKNKKKYNIVRHAGTLYALADLYNEFPSSDLKNTIKNATKFLEKNMLPITLKRKELLAIWTRRDNPLSGKLWKAKLGGTGLGLAGLCKVYQVDPSLISLSKLQKLANFILYMQKEDGSFYSKYFPIKGKDDTFTSLYYPGESALGLTLLYQIDPQENWLNSAINALLYLQKLRENKKEVEIDHWALIATKEILPFLKKNEAGESIKKKLISHAVKINNSLILAIENLPVNTPKGSFTSDARICPTATRLEGINASLSFLPETELTVKLKTNLTSGVKFLLRSQINNGKNKGGFPRAFNSLPKNYPKLSKKFNIRRSKIRIDYVQHSICAIAHARNFLFEKSQNSAR